MTNKDIGVMVAAILTTCLGEDRVPETPLMLGLQSVFPELSANQFIAVLGVLERAGHIKRVGNHQITLTEQGKLKAQELEKLIQKKGD